jgi:hypothetical protein
MPGAARVHLSEGLMVDQNAAFDREVSEELQRERLLKLWRDYQTLIIAGVIAIVGLVAGYQYIQGQARAAAEASGAKLVTATRELATRPEAGIAALEDLGRTGEPGVAALARLRAAGALAKSGKTTEAVALYDAMAKDVRVDRLFADFSRLQSAMLRVDSADWTEMENRLTDLTKETSPWRLNAIEVLGVAALKAGKTIEARQQFERLVAERNIPPALAERARVMLSVITEAELVRTAPSQPAAAPANTPAAATPAAQPAGKKAGETTGDKK